MPSENQVRLTIPSWIAKLKGWGKRTELQVVPIVEMKDKDIDEHTPFTIKVIQHDAKRKADRMEKGK